MGLNVKKRKKITDSNSISINSHRLHTRCFAGTTGEYELVICFPLRSHWLKADSRAAVAAPNRACRARLHVGALEDNPGFFWRGGLWLCFFLMSYISTFSPPSTHSYSSVNAAAGISSSPRSHGGVGDFFLSLKKKKKILQTHKLTGICGK